MARLGVAHQTPQGSAVRRFGGYLAGGLKLIAALLLWVSALVVGLVLFLAYPPNEGLRRAALPALRVALGNTDIELGHFHLRLRSRGEFELRDLLVGPPRGFTLPLLSLSRLRVRWDLGEVMSGKIAIPQVLIEHPVIRVERNAKGDSWLALLPPGPRAPPALDKAPPPTGKAASPLPWELRLGELAVLGLSLQGELGAQRVALEGLDLRVKGHYQRGRVAAEVAVDLGAEEALRTRVALMQGGKTPLALRLGTRLRIRAEVQGERLFRGKLSVAFKAKSPPLQLPLKVPPVELDLGLAARFDQARDEAKLTRLGLHLDGQELLRVRASLRGLSADPRLDASIERLDLPLALVQRFITPLAPGIKLAGAISSPGMRVRGPLSKLGGGLPPLASGELRLVGVGVRARPPLAPPVALAGLSGRLRFNLAAARSVPARMLAALPAPEAPLVLAGAAPAVVAAEFEVARFDGPNAGLRGLKLGLSAGLSLKGLAPDRAASKIALRVGEFRYHDAKLGTFRTGMRLALAAAADLLRQDLHLEKLTFSLGELLQLAASAELRAGGKRSLHGSLKIEPISLARLWRWLPARLRHPLPLTRLAGTVGARVRVRGRLPRGPGPAWAWPLHLDGALRLHKLAAQLKAPPSGGPTAPRSPLAGPSLAGLDGSLHFRGRFPRLQLTSSLALAEARLPALGLVARGLSLPLTASLRSDQVEASAALKLGRLRQRMPGLSLDTKALALRYGLSAKLPIAAVLRRKAVVPGRTDVSMGIGIERLRAGVGKAVFQLEAIEQELKVVHRPKQAVSLTLQVDGTVKQLKQEGGVSVAGAAYHLRAEVERGLLLRIPAVVFFPDQLAGRLAMDASLGELSLPGSPLPRAPRQTRLRLRARWPEVGALRVDQLAFSVPNYGLSAVLASQIELPRSVLLQPAKLFSRGLPRFRADLGLSLTAPDAASMAAARPLLPGLRLAGKAGLTFKLASLDRERLAIRGTLSAGKLCVWKRAVRSDADATTEQLIVLKELSADLPLNQELLVQLSPFKIKVPAPKRSVFEKGSSMTVYAAVRPFLGRRPALAFKRLAVIDTRRSLTNPKSAPSRSTLAIGPLAADMRIGDSTLALDRLHLRLFGGDVLGALHLQLPEGDPERARLRVDARMTAVDFAYLDSAARQRKEKAEVSALVALKTRWRQRDISGRIELTELSLKTFDGLLAFLDPHKVNPSIQRTRAQLNGWLARLANPEVHRVSVWLDHSKLNLDHELGARWPLGALMRQLLSGVLIRRISLAPYLPKSKASKERPDERKKTRRRARRSDDPWRLR